MTLRFTIRDEVSGDLCRTCRNALIYSDDSSGASRKICTYHMDCIRVEFPVTRCNQYEAVNEMAQHEAEKIAWVLDVNKKGEVIGFRPPKRGTD